MFYVCMKNKTFMVSERMRYIRSVFMRRSAFSAGKSDSRNCLESGESELICLHGSLHLRRLISDEWRKTLGLIWPFKNKKSAINVARLTVHEVDVRNRPYFSDKLVEDWRWQK